MRKLLGTVLCLITVTCGSNSNDAANYGETAMASPSIEVEAIAGGKATTPGQWPWSVYISWNHSWGDGTSLSGACSGSLIASNKILTAQHCLQYGDFLTGQSVLPSEINEIRVGSTSAITGGHTSAASSITRLAGYTDGYVPNDLAIIQTTSSFAEAPIPVAGIDNVWDIASEALMVIGYGGTTDESGGITLYQAPLEFVTTPQCNSIYGGIQIYGDAMCAGAPGGTTGVCEGDSGGPLMKLGPDQRYYLVGVTHGGHSADDPNSLVDFCDPSYPSVFIRAEYDTSFFTANGIAVNNVGLTNLQVAILSSIWP